MKAKKMFLVILSLVMVIRIYGQNEGQGVSRSQADQQDMKTLFGDNDRKIEHGGWGGFSMGYTSIDGKDAFITGGRGGWLIDHHFTLGLGGYGFMSNMKNFDQPNPTIENYSLTGGYGGLLLEPIFAPFNPVHISVPVLIGAGNAIVGNESVYHGYPGYDYASPFFVLEAGVDVEFNIVKFFRLAVYTSYRYTSNLSVDYYSMDGIKEFSVPDGALRGFNVGLTLKFGKF